MSNGTYRVVVLNSYANGTALTEENFLLDTRNLRPLVDGEVLLQTLALSPDPYMRGRMTGIDNFFLPQLALGEPVIGFGVARVIDSKIPAYQPGQVVHGMIEWAETSIWDGSGYLVGGARLEVLPPQLSPYGRALDVLGVTGLTAYFGVMEVAQPRHGETMLISGAAGSIGSIAGQIAMMRGARVIGIAGTDEKCAVLTQKLGFHAALNYRSSSLERELHEHMPNGPDIYFDNVGGSLSQTVMNQMRRPARVIECGQISTYDEDGGGWMLDIRPIHAHGLRFESFTPILFLDFHSAALAQLGHWLSNGKIIPLETVLRGIENGPRSLAGLFRGENLGKMLLYVGE
jgi:NADPH-dependent curcumin reductase CurA